MSQKPQVNLIDFNILPRQYRPSELPSKILILMVSAAAMAVLVLVGFLMSGRIKNASVQASADLLRVQQELQLAPTPVGETVELNRVLSETNGSIRRIEAVLPSIYGRSDWPEIAAAIDDYDGGHLSLESVTQVENEITLVGYAVDSAAVIGYVDGLKDSDVFANVSLLSMSDATMPFGTVTVTPTATSTATPSLVPTATITPTATLSPTPSPADAYEVDDLVPAPIVLNEQQQRNFYPIYDLDKASFLAKAGRFYRVFTSGLAAGVDTALTVHVGSASYSNDDCYTAVGDLVYSECPNEPNASLVEFKSDQDTEVVIVIENRGQYGSNQTYVLTIEDTGAREDSFEDDDRTPRPISIAEDQLHNFYPEGDVDKMRLLVKAGREYEISTFGLSAGVDTLLSVSVDGNVYTDDDSGSVPLSSRVHFLAVNEGSAVIAVSNKGRFGSDRWYHVSVVEIEPTPVPKDDYEPDDVVPGALSIGESQQHNFYPDGDVDRVQLLVKAGREYEIYTSGLADGVDTLMTVVVNGKVYQDDDSGPQPLASRVRFLSLSESMASITVSNKGRFGGDSWYQISATEIEPTPIPRDEYEPDDVVPKPIYVGQIQMHNLYPQSDIDRVQLNVKGRRLYEVFTYWSSNLPDIPITPVCPASLPPGVDTIIQVEGGGLTCEPLGCYNDDWGDYDWGPSYTCPGPMPGDYSSRVTFWSEHDGYVVITVRSKNDQYGPDRYYALYAWDLGALATPTPTVAPTSTRTPTLTPSPTRTLTPVPTSTPTLTSIAPTATSTPVTPTGTPMTATPTPATPYPSAGDGAMSAPSSTLEAHTLASFGVASGKVAGLASAIGPGNAMDSARVASLQGVAVKFVILLTLRAISP